MDGFRTGPTDLGRRRENLPKRRSVFRATALVLNFRPTPGQRLDDQRLGDSHSRLVVGLLQRTLEQLLIDHRVDLPVSAFQEDCEVAAVHLEGVFALTFNDLGPLNRWRRLD